MRIIQQSGEYTDPRWYTPTHSPLDPTLGVSVEAVGVTAGDEECEGAGARAFCAAGRTAGYTKTTQNQDQYREQAEPLTLKWCIKAK